MEICGSEPLLEKNYFSLLLFEQGNAEWIMFKVPILWNELPRSTQEDNCNLEFKKIIARMNTIYKNM